MSAVIEHARKQWASSTTWPNIWLPRNSVMMEPGGVSPSSTATCEHQSPWSYTVAGCSPQEARHGVQQEWSSLDPDLQNGGRMRHGAAYFKFILVLKYRNDCHKYDADGNASQGLTLTVNDKFEFFSELNILRIKVQSFTSISPVVCPWYRMQGQQSISSMLGSFFSLRNHGQRAELYVRNVCFPAL